MDIKDLKEGMRKVDAIGFVTELGNERKVSLKAGGEARVKNVTLKDESGSIQLVLWNDDIDRVKEMAHVAVSGGFVNQWNGKLQLSTGRYGTLTVNED